MEIWAHVFDKIKLENERMTLWNAICPFDTQFLPTLTKFEIVCQSKCVIPCVINLQAPPTPKFGIEYGAQDSPPSSSKIKTSDRTTGCNFQAQPPQQELQLPNQQVPPFRKYVTPIKIHPDLSFDLRNIQ